MQDVQRDLEIAYKDSNEKGAKIQKLNKQNRDLLLEANDLSKKIEVLDGKISYTNFEYFCLIDSLVTF